MNIVIIGSGNVATHLAKAFRDAKHCIVQVYSRNLAHAERLAEKVGAEAIDNLRLITDDASMYLFSITDNALLEMLPFVPRKTGTWLHTAGCLSMHVFKGYSRDYGVLYPLQTFSKTRTLNISDVPIFIESNRPDKIEKIEQLARSISPKVEYLSSEKRKYLHLSAVFACNFVNHLYALSEEILKEQHIRFDVLKPLILETADKIQSMSPHEAQTGPAVRNDTSIIEKHLEMLDDANYKEIYRLISEQIYKMCSP